MSKIIGKYYNATIATWFGFFARAISFVVVLPLLLSKFDPERIAVWYLFDSILALQLLFDAGFRVTLVRLVAYCFGGKNIFNKEANLVDEPGKWMQIYSLFKGFRKYYLLVTLVFLLLLSVGGTYALVHPISKIADKSDAWIAWCVLVLTTCLRMYYGVFISVLEGLNRIVLVRTLDAASAIFAVLSAFVALYLFTPSLLLLVCCYQFWLVMNCLRDQYLVRKVFRTHHVNRGDVIKMDKEQSREMIVYPSLKTGLSSLFSVGTTNITNLTIAQFAHAQVLAPYLLALRIVNIIRDVSMAPFYSKIPYLSQLRAKGDNESFFNTARKGMFLSYFVFVFGVLACGFLLPPLLKVFESQINFVDARTWVFISLAFLLHRYGAMHIQLQMIGNVIKSHIADGVSALIYALVLLASYKVFQINAIPIAMIVSYLCFYCWYAAWISSKTYKINLLHFEAKNFIAAFSLFLIGSIILIFLVS